MVQLVTQRKELPLQKQIIHYDETCKIPGHSLRAGHSLAERHRRPPEDGPQPWSGPTRMKCLWVHLWEHSAEDSPSDEPYATTSPGSLGRPLDRSLHLYAEASEPRLADERCDPSLRPGAQGISSLQLSLGTHKSAMLVFSMSINNGHVPSAGIFSTKRE